MVVGRGTIVICILSIFSIFVQDVHVPYYIHAAGSQASMIIGKTLALISLRGVVSSQRLHGVVIDTTLLATGSSYGKVPALTSRGAIISSRMNGVLLKAPPSSSEFESNDQLYLDHLLRESSEARATASSTWITSSANHRKQKQRPVSSGLSTQLLFLGKFYLDYLLRVSSEACFNKVQSIRHSFQHSSRTKKIRPMHDPLTVDNMQVQSLDSTPRQHSTQLISSCSSALVGLLGQAKISACIFKQTAQQY